MNENEKQRNETNGKTETARHRFRLPGFVSEEEIGLGDLVKRVTSSAGIKPCGACEKRAAALNRWLSVGGGGATKRD
jgi:hypothetical protein